MLTTAVLGQDRAWSYKPPASRTYLVDEGSVTFRFDVESLETLGLRFVAQGQLASDTLGRMVVLDVDLTDAPAVEFSPDGVGRLAGGRLATCGAFLLDRPGERMVIGNLALCPIDGGDLRLRSTLGESDEIIQPFDLGETWMEFDRVRRQWHMQSELLLNGDWAQRLGIPEFAGASVGAVTIEALLSGGREPIEPPLGPTCERTAAVDRGPTVAGVIGSDILVADLQSIIRYNPVGDINAFAVGTTACNIGDRRADWISQTNQHPVIAQNLYRLREDRFEQIGMSWVKHGFYAVSESFCEACGDPTNGTQLGVGCSDPYSATLNGVQTNMSPRSTVNANTGYFPYPWSAPVEGTVARRLQVRAADLDPTTNPNARYFIEGHYIHPNDCVAGTQDNNASYREVRLIVTGPGAYSLAVTSAWTTQRGKAAVRAWHDADPAVLETDIRVPGEGLFILAAKATARGDGYWRYSYALQNLNSDRSARSFTLLLPPGAVVENTAFHGVQFHSGEPYSGAPWTVVVTPSEIAWSTESYDVNPMASALRFDSIANFYFDSNVEPDTAKAEIGLFTPGFPVSASGNTIGPRVAMLDCNENSVSDLCDVNCGGAGCGDPCGTSTDCNHNSVPDECEMDCNGNGIADQCDVLNCPPQDASCADCNQNGAPDICDADCDGDGIPDECEQVIDTDMDGVDDCDDLCPYTTPPGDCLPPWNRLVVCCFPSGVYAVNVFTWRQCTDAGGGAVCDDPPMCPGTPCRESVCRQGCLLSDCDGDGDLDLRDFSDLQACFSGSVDDPDFLAPSAECLRELDVSEDGDVDAEDYISFEERCDGPE